LLKCNAQVLYFVEMIHVMIICDKICKLVKRKMILKTCSEDPFYIEIQRQSKPFNFVACLKSLVDSDLPFR